MRKNGIDREKERESVVYVCVCGIVKDNPDATLDLLMLAAGISSFTMRGTSSLARPLKEGCKTQHRIWRGI